MTSATDVIAALNQRRLLKTGRPDHPGAMPGGWQGWFDALEPIDTQTARAHVDACVAGLAQKPLPQLGKSGGLGLPFFQLLRLGRPPDPREDRKLRIGAGVADLVLHLVLAALLLWLMYLRFLALSQLPEEQDQAVQVEFIGRGNAVEGGGALANAGAQSTPASAAASRSASRQASTQPQQSATAATSDSGRPDLVQQAMPMPQAVDISREAPKLMQAPPALPVTAAQELQVSNVPQPQPEVFQLPPPREHTVRAPEVQLREVPQQQVEQIPTLQAQPVRTLQPTQRQAQLRAPVLSQQVQSIEVFTANPSQLTRQRAAPVAQAQLQVPQLRGQVRELPLRAGNGEGGDAGAAATQAGRGQASNGNAASQGAGGNATTQVGNGQAQAGAGAGARAAVNGGRGISTAGTGAGPGLKAASGGWPGAGKSDDWGASNRNAAGTGTGSGNDKGNGRNGDGKPGLFNADGSARLPDTWSKNSGVDLDRSGTWLKRPGLEYRGTRFDKYWIPEGNLLQEWVRKGVKELSIPIPGTKLKLKCVVSLLQFGGGCMPENPDVNEQSATGRKAPEIPFKPELQENNGSVRPAAQPVDKP